jgi:hypothetical protein
VQSVVSLSAGHRTYTVAHLCAYHGKSQCICASSPVRQSCVSPLVPLLCSIGARIRMGIVSAAQFTHPSGLGGNAITVGIQNLMLALSSLTAGAPIAHSASMYRKKKLYHGLCASYSARFEDESFSARQALLLCSVNTLRELTKL